jgi:DNA-binding transcriptional regulator YdaS (Cro superfamily)
MPRLHNPAPRIAGLVSGVKLAINAVEGHRKLARLLGISHQAIGQWDRVPAERLIEIEILTGVERERLRPDLFLGFKRETKNAGQP